VLLPAWGVPARAIQFIVYAALLGFPISLAFGWLYDLGPDGISRTLPAGAGEKTEPETNLSRKDILLLAIMSVAFVAIGGWLIDQLMHDEIPTPTGPPNSVAVLAFEDSDGSGNPIAIDLADQLVTTLISISGLKVTGRESSFYFAGRSTPLPEIAHVLNVRHLLTGRVSHSGEQLSVSVQLIRMPEETAIWAQTFSTAAYSAYEIFGTIGEQVAGAMRINVSDASRLQNMANPVGNREALDLVRLSRQALESREMDRAIGLVEQAIELDTGIAPAHTLRARYYLLSFSTFGKPEIETVRQVARESLDRAEALGADDFEYFYTRGMQARRETWFGGGTPAWQKAVEENFDRAIALNPSDAQSYVSYSIYFRRARRYNDSARLLETALDYDPLHPGAILQYSRSLSALGRRDEAFQYALRLPELYGFGEREIAFRYREYGQLDDAVEWFLKASPDDPRNLRDIAEILGSLQAPESAVAWLEKISDDEVFGPVAASRISAIRGDVESAYTQLATLIDLSAPDEEQNPAWLYTSARLALKAGRAEQAIALIERLFPELGDPLAPGVTEQNSDGALLLAIALSLEEGNEVRVGILSGMILNATRNRPASGWDGIGLQPARVYALQGESSKAIESFQAAYDQGFRQVYTAEGQLPQPLEMLAGNPRFDQLLEKIDADLGVMRERAITLVESR
jgi:TolB-like protein